MSGTIQKFLYRFMLSGQDSKYTNQPGTVNLSMTDIKEVIDRFNFRHMDCSAEDLHRQRRDHAAKLKLLHEMYLRSDRDLIPYTAKAIEGLMQVHYENYLRVCAEIDRLRS